MKSLYYRFRTNIMKATFLTQYSKANKHVKFGGLQVASAEAGCFEIETGNDFTSEDNLLIGMSMNDPSGGKYPVPVATVSIPL